MKDGDEVLTTPLTCTATNWPILANNFKIKWVDVDPKTLNMDMDDLERKITKNTRAIMVVHWGGYPVDLDRLRQIQEKSMRLYGFKPAVIEDCAHSMGSKYKGKLIGTHGNICTFSLQAIKHITSVDGGLLFLPHQELNRRARLLRWYGIDRDSPRKDFRCEADIEEWGFKFHMNDVCATVGLENLKHASTIIEAHKSNAKFYDSNLQGIPGLTTLTRHDNRESSFWIYSLLVDRRDDFMKHMKECGIVVSQVHERNDKHSCVSEYKSNLPVLDATISKIVSIPVGWWVTEEQRQYIVNCIKKGW
jgi:dTDP-4-amino-4,6-dideoxygalactose transaminase